MTNEELSDILQYVGAILMAIGFAGLSGIGVVLAFTVGVPLGFLAIFMVGIATALIGTVLRT
jgi:hypothetical protein